MFTRNLFGQTLFLKLLQTIPQSLTETPGCPSSPAGAPSSSKKDKDKGSVRRSQSRRPSGNQDHEPLRVNLAGTGTGTGTGTGSEAGTETGTEVQAGREDLAPSGGHSGALQPAQQGDGSHVSSSPPRGRKQGCEFESGPKEEAEDRETTDGTCDSVGR